MALEQLAARRRRWLGCIVVAMALLVGPAAHADSRTLWLHNLHTHETIRLQPFRGGGRIDQRQWRLANHFFRSWRTDLRRPVHPRLLATLRQIQVHFGGHRLELVSGYRVPERGAALSSYHQVGRAADIYIDGVPDRALFEYCRTLSDVGCGFYPAGHHVHVDVRGHTGLWVDTSRPGNGRPHYVGQPLRWLEETRAGTPSPRGAPRSPHGDRTGQLRAASLRPTFELRLATRPGATNRATGTSW